MNQLWLLHVIAINIAKMDTCARDCDCSLALGFASANHSNNFEKRKTKTKTKYCEQSSWGVVSSA